MAASRSFSKVGASIATLPSRARASRIEWKRRTLSTEATRSVATTARFRSLRERRCCAPTGSAGPQEGEHIRPSVVSSAQREQMGFRHFTQRTIAEVSGWKKQLLEIVPRAVAGTMMGLIGPAVFAVDVPLFRAGGARTVGPSAWCARIVIDGSDSAARL